MKKLLLFLLTLMLGFSTLQVSAQETLTVHDGTATNGYVPVYGFYADAYLKAEFVISANDLTDMTGGSISGMKFYSSTSSASWGVANFQVFLTEVNNESISAFEGTGNATIVYTGPLSIANGEMEITFSTEYTYSGGNLLVGIYNTVEGTYVSCSWYGETVNGASVQGYSYSDLASVSPSQRNFIPKTTFTYTPSGTNCFSPNNPTISEISAYEATLSWTPRDGQTAWEVCCVSGVFDPDQASWTPVTDTFYTFTNLDAATNYTAYVRTDCGTEVSNPRQTSFTTEATCPNIPSNISVSNITATTVDVNWTAGFDDSAWEVVVVPSNAAPETGIPEQTTDHPYTVTNLQDNTQYKVYVRTDCGGGDHSYWSSPKTFTTLPFCSSPRNVTISQITASSALVSWQPATYGATSYTIEYSFANEENWTMEVVDGTQFMLTNLEPDSSYNVMVYSNCDIGTADTVHKNFTTKHCLVGGDLQIGEGTNTTSYYPTNSCYNYSYTQQIFLASEMNGATNINSIAFDVNSIQSSSRQISIYLMHTSAASSDWLTATNAQLVFTGTVNLTLGWNTFNFTTPFQYNGTDNLALIILDATGSYNCSNYYNCHTASSTLSHCEYQDDDPYSINSLPSDYGYSDISSTRCNVIFGTDCNDDATCIRPNVYVTEVSESSVTLDWAPGYDESAWDIQYSTNDTTWEDAGTVNTHPYEVTGLNSDTKYNFRVRSNCGSEESDWSGANARTACGPITQLPYFNNFDDVISIDGTNFITCWSRYTTNPDRVVRCYGSATHSGSYALDFNYSPSCTTAVVTPMIDPSIPLNMVMLDFWAYSGLGQGWMEVGTMSDPNDFSTYEFFDTVRLSAPSTWENLVISFENYTGSNQYIAFLEINGTTTSYIFDDFTIDYATNCFHPTNLVVDSITDNSVTLSWTEVGTATDWLIEYGPVGFTPGNGTSVSASANPFTVENLTPATPYDFYVYANCGSEQSTPFGPVSATPGQYIMAQTGSDTLTTCGMMIYDNGGANGDYSNYCNSTLVLYPANPGDMMMITGTNSSEPNTYSGGCYDYLQIYDGVGTSGTQLVNSCGTDQTIRAISTTGPLTIYFYSDGSNVESGFALLAQCSSCNPPTNVTSSNSTIDGATVSWSGNGDSYLLFLNGNMTTGYESDDTTYTFTGLNASTIYSVQVASICNGDTSMLSAAATFATACDAITITEEDPWTETFENYTGSQFICWEVMSDFTADNGTFPTIYNWAPACHSGTKSIEFKGDDLMLVLPEFSNTLSDLRLSFWATKVGGNSAHLEIGYVTDVNDTSSFVFVANAGTPGDRGSSSASVGSFGNYMGPYDFNGVTAPAGARIALRYIDNSASYSGSMSYNLDDFTVELTPDCPSPVKTSVTATNLGGHVATISWVDNDDTHTAWTVYYKASADSVWNTAPATDTTVTLTDLNPTTNYDVYVVTDCNTPTDNPDATHTIHFTTTVACPAPTGLTLASVSTDEATITWNGIASSYNVEYGETGFTPGSGTPDVAYSESITLTSLTPSTSYTIYVNSDCNDTSDSLSTTVSFTFTTTQVPEALPYTADFTASNEWILNNGSCSNYWATGSVNATPSLFVTNNGTTPGYNIGSTSVVSAEKLLAVGDNASVVVSFDAYVGGEGTSEYSYDYLKVFFAPAETEYPASTSTPTYASYTYETNAVNFQNYLSQTGCSYNPYKLSLTNDTLHVTVEMPNPNENPTSASTAKLVFLWRNDQSQGTMPGAIISNVNVSVNSCPMPTALAVDNITTNSADISWNASDEISAWVLEYQAEGSTTWTVENVTSTPEYTINNLATATTYNVRVKSDCGNEESGYQTISFTTQCDVITTLPYTQNFDNISSGSESAFPNCWARPIQYSGYPYAVTAYSHSTPASLRFQSLTTSPTTAVTPQFAEDIHNLQLNFWLKAESTTSSGTFEVGVMTDPNDVSSFTGVWTIQPTSTSWTEYTLNFDTTAISGTNKHIAFRQHSNSSIYYYWLDDVVIDLNNGSSPTDPTVTTTAASAIGQTTATLNATISNPSGVTIDACGFQWKALSDANYTTVTLPSVAATMTHNLTGLTANTNYTYKAFITVNGVNIEGNDVNFTTQNDQPQTCNVPTGLATANVTYNAADVNWTAGGTETAWNVQYKLASASNWGNSIPVTAATYHISGLNAETAYQVRVQANCGDNNTSNWTDPVSFTTPAAPADPCNAPTNLQVGNITQNSATMTWTAGGNETTWKVGYKLSTASQWQEATVQQTSYEIEGLTANSTYDVRVKAVCAADNESDFISTTFTTTGVGIDNVTLANSINLMPNPADNYIELGINSNVEVKEAVIFNAFGQMIQTIQLTDNHARIDLSNMAAGMYFVRVNGEDVSATKKFIKR